MTESRTPVTWRARIAQTLAMSGVLTLGVGGFLAVQAATGNDPALRAIAARAQAEEVRRQSAERAWRQANARAQAAAATPRRRVVIVRKVILTRRVSGAAVTTRFAAGAAPAPAAAPAAAADVVTPAAPVSAPPPIQAPPPPVVSQGS